MSNVVKIGPKRHALDAEGKHVIATGTARQGKVHADLPHRPLNENECRNVEYMLNIIRDDAKEQKKVEVNQNTDPDPATA
jgi:hypothetical protein